MSDWTFVAQTANCLGNRIGEEATLRRNEPIPYNPTLGVYGTATTTDYTITVKDVKLERTGFDPSTVEMGDRFVGVPAQNLTIEPDVETDTLIIDGVTWFIKEYKTKRIGSTVLSYMFHVKR